MTPFLQIVVPDDLPEADRARIRNAVATALGAEPLIPGDMRIEVVSEGDGRKAESATPAIPPLPARA